MFPTAESQSYILELTFNIYYHLVFKNHHSPFGILPLLNGLQLGHNAPSPSGSTEIMDASDLPKVSSVVAELLATASDPVSEARLLSACLYLHASI